MYPVIFKEGNLIENTKKFLKSKFGRTVNLFGKELVSDSMAQEMKKKIDKDENNAVKSVWPGVLYHALELDKNETERLNPLILANTKFNPDKKSNF